MNIKRLLHLAEWLRNGAKHATVSFNMRKGLYFKEVIDFDAKEPTMCQTSCCIAGATVQFFNDPMAMAKKEFENGRLFVREDENDKPDREIEWYKVREEAETLLGLEYEQANELFEPNRKFGGALGDYNDPAWAARTIYYLLATGKADWSATRAMVL